MKKYNAMVKICKDCKYYIHNIDYLDKSNKIANPERKLKLKLFKTEVEFISPNIELCIKLAECMLNPVTGEKEYINLKSCYEMRRSICGEEGKYWEESNFIHKIKKFLIDVFIINRCS